MEKMINVGVIGCGVISGMHLRALENIPGVRLAALCDIDRPRAESLAENMPNVAVYSDYREMLKDNSIDSVHILTPHYLHAQMTVDALSSGKYVLCEKPMATSLGDARSMIEADIHHRLGIIFQNRYNAATGYAKQRIDSGELGKIVAIKGIVTWKRDEAYYRSGAWRGKWDTEGGGVLINQAIHTIDQIIYLGGAIGSVKGSVSRDCLGEPYEVEDNAHAVMAFSAGHRAIFYASNSFGVDDPPMIDICLEQGRLRMLGDQLFEVFGGEMRPLVLPDVCDNGAKAVYGNSHAIQIADFYRCIREDRTFWLDGLQAYPAIWTVLSIYESSRSGRWIDYGL